MSSSRTVVDSRRLRSLSSVIQQLAHASHLTDPRVYGSIARGEGRADSDLDILVTPTHAATLFDIAQFEMDLELLLDIPVSVVSASALDPERDAHIIAEAIPL